jgi:hypothetical protein
LKTAVAGAQSFNRGVDLGYLGGTELADTTGYVGEPGNVGTPAGVLLDGGSESGAVVEEGEREDAHETSAGWISNPERGVEYHGPDGSERPGRLKAQLSLFDHMILRRNNQQ